MFCGFQGHTSQKMTLHLLIVSFLLKLIQINTHMHMLRILFWHKFSQYLAWNGDSRGTPTPPPPPPPTITSQLCRTRLQFCNILDLGNYLVLLWVMLKAQICTLPTQHLGSLTPRFWALNSFHCKMLAESYTKLYSILTHHDITYRCVKSQINIKITCKTFNILFTQNGNLGDLIWFTMKSELSEK